MTKTIQLTIEQAREMLGKDAAMDKLILANFTEDELKPKYPKRWVDLVEVSGWYVNASARLIETMVETHDWNKGTFHTKQQAISFGVIYPQLTQLMARYRDGWEPNWDDEDQIKYGVLMHSKQHIIVLDLSTYRQPISFQSLEIAQQFIQDHRFLILKFFKGM